MPQEVETYQVKSSQFAMTPDGRLALLFDTFQGQSFAFEMPYEGLLAIQANIQTMLQHVKREGGTA